MFCEVIKAHMGEEKASMIYKSICKSTPNLFPIHVFFANSQSSTGRKKKEILLQEYPIFDFQNIKTVDPQWFFFLARSLSRHHETFRAAAVLDTVFVAFGSQPGTRPLQHAGPFPSRQCQPLAARHPPPPAFSSLS